MVSCTLDDPSEFVRPFDVELAAPAAWFPRILTPSDDQVMLPTIAAVAQAYVTDVTQPTAESVGAAVVTREHLTVEALDREAKARLSAFKVPKRWAPLGSTAEVPTMATGKVDKKPADSVNLHF